MGNTLQLIVIGAVVSCVLALAIGVYSAVQAVLDARLRLHRAVLHRAWRCRPFWFGLIAIQFFAVRNNWLLSLGLHTGDSTAFDLDYLRHLPLPIATLCVQIVASWSRYERASMLDALERRLRPHGAGQGPARDGPWC